MKDLPECGGWYCGGRVPDITQGPKAALAVTRGSSGARTFNGLSVRSRLVGLVAMITVVACALSSPPVSAQTPAPQILISPTAPTISDVVQITINTFRPCYPTGPGDGITTAVLGSNIQVTALLTCTTLTTPPPPLVITQNVGPLSAATYQVQYITNPGGTLVVLATSTFQVSAIGPLPIDALSGTATVLLILLVGLFGFRILKPQSKTQVMLLAIGIVIPLYMLQSTSAFSAQTTISQSADHQLIVLFDPLNPNSPSAQTVVVAVTDPTQNPDLVASLSSPIAARRMLAQIRSAPDFLSELAKNPLAPRALLEQYVVLTYSDPETRNNAYGVIARDPRVLSVEFNASYSLSSTPNDTYFSFNPSLPNAGDYQWGMQILNLQSAWDKQRGIAYIADLDDGIYCSSISPCITHSDLQQNFRSQFSTNVGYLGTAANFDENVSGTGYNGHGTHVAGIIAATPNNSAGVAGACWTCSLVVIRYETTTTSGFDYIAAGLTYAVDHGIQVVNMSFGDEYSTPRFSSCSTSGYAAMCTALAYANERDVALVAAAGNRYENRLQFPAQDPSTIAVGGIQSGGYYWNNGYGDVSPTNCTSPPTAQDECGSNYGTQSDGSMQVVGPAMDIVSTFYPGYEWNHFVHCADTWGPNSGALPSGYGDCTGTSMSAPHVTGIVGLMRSTDPLLTKAQVKAAVINNAIPCTAGSDSSKCGAGIPDAGASVTTVLGTRAAKNRLTPLFSLYSIGAADHVYTVVPQMAVAALNSGQLIPQPPSTSISYGPIGNATPGYTGFPHSTSCFSPCASASTPQAMVSVFTSHVDPTDPLAELVPPLSNELELFRIV
jgi:serine protease